MSRLDEKRDTHDTLFDLKVGDISPETRKTPIIVSFRGQEPPFSLESRLIYLK